MPNNPDPKDYTDGIAFPYQWMDEEQSEQDKKEIKKEKSNSKIRTYKELLNEEDGTKIIIGRKDPMEDW